MCCVCLGLADLEAGEPLDGQSGLVDDLLDRLLRLGDRRLLEQHEVLEVGVDPTLDDLADRLLGLALLLGGLLGDATLGLDRLGRDLLAAEVARTRSGDVHRQAARGVLAATGVLHGDTDGRGQVGGALVQVGGGLPLEDGEPAQHELLADTCRLALDQGRNGLAVDLGREQGVDVGRLLGEDDVEQALGERDEVGVLGDEVGLAVELEQSAVLVHDHAVGGGALEALADVLGALDAQELDGLVVVAVGLGQGLLAVHHAGAGGVAETLDVGCGELSHVTSSVVWGGAGVRCGHAAAPSPPLAGTAPGDQPFWAPWVPVSVSPVAGTPAVGATSFAVTVGGSAGVSGSGVAVASAAGAAAASPPVRSSRSQSARGSSPPMAGSAPSSRPAFAWAAKRAMRPSATASATTRVSTAMLRMASSLPGIL